jgi:peptide/nickel transport system ATP-binding protein
MDRAATDPGGRLTPIAGSPPSLLNLPPGCPFTPRCPMAADLCDREEPALLATDQYGHHAACHFHDRLIDTEAADVFATTSADTEPEVSGR